MIRSNESGLYFHIDWQCWALKESSYIHEMSTNHPNGLLYASNTHDRKRIDLR